MKRVFNLIGVLFFVFFCSCQDKESIAIGNLGYLQLNIAASSSVSTKAEDQYDAKQIAVKIIDSNGVVVKQTDDWETWTGTIELSTGEYTIQASSNGFDGKTAAFDKPYYAGSKKIVIEKGKTVTANVTCSLANVKVHVSFSESYRKAFKAGTVQISVAEEGATHLSFLMSENLSGKYAYFPAKPLAWSIAVKNRNDVTKTLRDTIKAVAARDYLKFNFTVASSSNITISVDETTKDYFYTVGIPTVMPEFRVTTGSTVNSWNRHAEIKGEIFSQTDINLELALFKYKEANEETWKTIKPTVTNTATSTYAASATISGLLPATSYKYALCYDDGTLVGSGDTLLFTTEAETPLYNGNFDLWNKVDKTWYAATAAEGRNAFWDSGNAGSTTGAGALVNVNPAYPTTDVVHTAGGKAGALQSQFASAVGIGKFAAGNVYTGHFVKLVSTKGAQLEFGQPFTSRPTKLHGWFQYKPGVVDYANFGLSKGDTDVNSIYIALSDKGSPYLIDNTKAETFINYETDPNIIAYGELPASECVSTNGQWKEFTINLKYRSLTRKPTHIIIVASASKYGDYFTGSTSSVMYIDDFELLYDGEPEVKTK